MKNHNQKIMRLFNTWALNGRAERMAEGHANSINAMLNMLEEQDNFSLFRAKSLAFHIP